MRIAVFISGRGSNMVSLAEAARRPGAGYEIVGVLSNRGDASGLERAAELGLPTLVVDHKAYDSREAFERAIESAIDPLDADVICLAGFMRKLSPYLVNRYAGRIVNIHPSLLPAFRGLNPHAQALAAGVKIHGCTVHVVSEELDAGPILSQAALPVLPGDTADTLAERLIRIEHRLYPATIGAIAAGRLSLDGSSAVSAGGADPDQLLFSV